VLDCGCGPGAWIDAFSGLKPAERAEFFGFDLTPEMVEVAKSRLRGRLRESNLNEGDILSDASYTFGKPGRSYEIVYAFDVVQQLPRSKQLDAVLAMLKHVKPGGCAVVFDHDRWSQYGLKMGFRKFVTKYLKIALVPEYYCNARYPALARLGSRIAAMGPYSVDVRMAPDRKKRALVVWRREYTPVAPGDGSSQVSA
jgi:SAM-dependent methyltransferase